MSPRPVAGSVQHLEGTVDYILTFNSDRIWTVAHFRERPFSCKGDPPLTRFSRFLPETDLRSLPISLP